MSQKDKVFIKENAMKLMMKVTYIFNALIPLYICCLKELK